MGKADGMDIPLYAMCLNVSSESDYLQFLQQPVYHRSAFHRYKDAPRLLYTALLPGGLDFDRAAVHYTHSPPCQVMSTQESQTQDIAQPSNSKIRRDQIHLTKETA